MAESSGPNARSLPVAAEHREFTVDANGTAMPRSHQLLALSITKRVNKISAARLVYLDGAASSSDFPLSGSDLLGPGTKVAIFAGAEKDRHQVFQGLVVRLNLRIRENGPPQLVIDCRHAATRLTIGRRDRLFADRSDADIAEALLDEAGLEHEVQATSPVHSQQVQFRATDWDFLLARAHANGRVILTNGDQVVVKTPALGASPVVTLHFGATLLELDAEIDARRQLGVVRGRSWDPARQELVELEAADPGVAGPGNFEPDALAAVAAPEHFDLCHAALPAEEAQAWADATLRRARFDKVAGRVKCQGIATIEPGDVVTLSGVGSRFSGDVYVTGVRQDFDLVQGWKTHVQFGGLEPRADEDAGVSAPAAGALLPAVTGLQVGVAAGNEDPAGEHRVKVRLPLVGGADDGLWARVASPDAGKDRGFFFRPEVGDELVVGFLEGDPRQAIVLGMLASSQHAAPLAGADDNHQKVLQSRSGLRLLLDDEKKVLTLETPAGNRLRLDEDGKKLSLEDQNGNSLVFDPDGIQLKSVKAFELGAKTEIKLESGTSLAVKGGTELKLEGAASAELSSSATAKIKGGVVQIN